jgi:FimV-like protein
VNCKVVAEDHIIERYSAGQLDEADAEGFEQHFFECEECFGALRDHAAVRDALSNLPRDEAGRSKSFFTDTNPWWLLAAAMLLLGLGLILWLAPWAGSPSSQTLVAASVVEAPPYEPRTLRSVSGQGELPFLEAMVSYQEGHFAEAIPGLETAVKLDPGLAKAHFYLGACYLLEDHPRKAIESLNRVAEIEGSPYREWTHFYRAKAYLRLGDLDSALENLSEVISVGGELQTQAQKVLEQLPD